MYSSLWILLAVVFVLLVIPIGIYNGLVSRRNSVDNAFASLDANLQKRFDLIPNLVAAVKGYMTHERSTLEELTRIRSEAQSGGSATRLQNDAAASQLLGQIMVVAENYPQLRASDNFLNLQRTLNEVEEQISASRRAFNASVTEYNTAIQTFPGALVAGPFGFSRRELFATTEAVRQAPNLTGQF